MARYVATITVEIQRANGSSTQITETIQHSGGDNPRFERSESEEAISKAMRATLHRVDPEFTQAGRP